ncbi:MAG: queuosine precursor transporter [Bacteroidetes bacterium]|nr:queuosine precursor transporter [Bacteroidota bacterium]
MNSIEFRKQKFPINESIYNLLLGLFISIVLITNLITGKYFVLYKLSLTAGVITYPFTFLITDIISELYGLKRANQTILMGFLASIFMTLMLYVAKILPIHINSPIKQNTLESVFCFTPGIVIGSMVAFLISQFADTHIFQYLKNLTNSKHLWLRNNLATMLSQLLDTFVFALTTWSIWYIFSDKVNFDISISLWIKIAAYEYLVKCIFALLDTPILYMAVYLIKKYFKK